MYIEQYKILGCHVPKTAGTFLNTLLNRDSAINGNVRSCDLSMVKHSTIKEYQKKFSKKEWDNLYKFTCIREPHERFLSYYLNHWIYKDDYLKSLEFSKRVRRKTFNDWVKNQYAEMAKNNSVKVDTGLLKKINSDIYHFYLSNSENNIEFDYYLDFENVEEDLFRMCFDYVGKNVENNEKIARRFWKYISPTFFLDDEDSNLKPKASLPNRVNLEKINPSKSRSESEKATIRSIQKIGLDYFYESSLAIFRNYNSRDLELYRSFKERREVSRSSL